MQKEITQIINHSKEDFQIAIMMPAYNHENFIKQAIEGVLMQQTNYCYRLFILDDCSTDGTFDMCKYYTDLFPSNISLYKNRVNIGAYKSGEVMRDICFSSNAKYLAFCEGDDYWTDKNKLQKQVDFLEANSEFTLCFHAVMILKDNKLVNDYITRAPEAITTINDLSKGNYIQTVSSVFRNCLQELPPWFTSLNAGDYPLHLLLAEQGKIYYFDEVMAVYRVHAKGIWSNAEPIKLLQGNIYLLTTLSQHFKSKIVKHNLNAQLKYIVNSLFYLMVSTNKIISALSLLYKKGHYVNEENYAFLFKKLMNYLLWPVRKTKRMLAP